MRAGNGNSSKPKVKSITFAVMWFLVFGFGAGGGWWRCQDSWVVMTCWWHQDTEQSLFSAHRLKVRHLIHWPRDLFPGPPTISNHTESRVYAVSARFCVKWARHRDKNAFSLSLRLGPSFSLVQVGCRMTGRPHLHVVSPQQVNAFKMQQKSSWHLTRECNLNDNTSSLCCSRWRS